MTIFLLFILLLAYYYFILRKYNTLGFRLFSLCVFVSAAMLYWWWGDWRELKKVERSGITTEAMVQQKKQQGSEWVVEVAIKGGAGNTTTRVCKGGMSDEELANVQLNQPTAIRYSADSDTFFLEQSFLRQNRDMAWFLLFPGIFLLLGCAAWFFLRAYRIHPHEGTIYEYMTDESGQVVLDDAKDEGTKNVRKGWMIWKLMEILK